MYIAVCDDDIDELSRISTILDEYRLERNVPVLYKVFQNAADLLAVAESSCFSLYLLDIVMPGTNGINAAKAIRSFDIAADLVFLTSSTEFAYQSYSVKAHDYLIKPANAEKLFSLLDDLFARRQEPKESILLKTKGGMMRIPFSNLVYVEVVNRSISFHMADGQVRETIATLSAFEALLLSRPEFIRVHRSFIVNLWQVSDFSQNGLIACTGDRIPVSRRLYSKVRQAYVEQSFSKEVM